MTSDKTRFCGPTDIFDELREHRRRFLLVVILSGVAFATLFLQSSHFGLISLEKSQAIANGVYIMLALPIAALLWRFPRFYGIAVWSYDAVTTGLFVAALVAMPQDELRVIWFFLLVAGAFSLIGTAAGWAKVVVCFLAVMATDAMGLIQYSGNAIVTFTICLIVSGIFFHAANWQVASFIDRIGHTTRHLRQASQTDPLTGLANNWAMADAWEQLSRTTQPIGFLFVDVDHFKSINDSFGHACGDLVLKTIADALKESVGDKAVAGRIGGEEFAILLPGATLDRALVVAEGVRQAVENARPTIGGRAIDITTSVGVAVSEAPHPPQGFVKRAADAALYRAKQLGRNRVVAAEAELPV